MSNIIKWKNIHSGDEGYVKSISSKNKCFENTFDKSEAKQYSSNAIAQKMIRTLEMYGEGADKNNELTVLTV